MRLGGRAVSLMRMGCGDHHVGVLGSLSDRPQVRRQRLLVHLVSNAHRVAQLEPPPV